MKKSDTLRIDLHLPRHWDALTTPQMEVVADCIMREIAAGGKSGAYNPKKVKMDIFLRLTGLEIIESVTDSLPPEERYFIAVKKNESENRMKRIYMKLTGNSYTAPFKVYIWQVNQWIDECLKWLDNTSNRTVFPYPIFKSKGRIFRGPSRLMQNFNWRQYRISSDYYDYYLSESNSLVRYAARKDCNPRKLADMQKTVRNARNLLLASLFCEEVDVRNAAGLLEKDNPYILGQEAKNKDCFEKFTDIQMQVILFWWMGMMDYLQRKFPKVFKKGNPKKQQQVNPFEVYTRMMTNLQKYLNGASEEQINNATYTIMLENLNDMMEEHERMERRKG
jgi:hypothetical protein|nr:MAG TPA: hypothetical protein [Caudoviricetes sp.]